MALEVFAPTVVLTNQPISEIDRRTMTPSGDDSHVITVDSQHSAISSFFWANPGDLPGKCLAVLYSWFDRSVNDFVRLGCSKLVPSEAELCWCAEFLGTPQVKLTEVSGTLFLAKD